MLQSHGCLWQLIISVGEINNFLLISVLEIPGVLKISAGEIPRFLGDFQHQEAWKEIFEALQLPMATAEGLQKFFQFQRAKKGTVLWTAGDELLGVIEGMSLGDLEWF